MPSFPRVTAPFIFSTLLATAEAAIAIAPVSELSLIPTKDSNPLPFIPTFVTLTLLPKLLFSDCNPRLLLKPFDKTSFSLFIAETSDLLEAAILLILYAELLSTSVDKFTVSTPLLLPILGLAGLFTL